MVRVEATHTGSVRFVNCSFWGPCNKIAHLVSKGTVGFGDCTFVLWDARDGEVPAIQAESGTILIKGCEFQKNAPHVHLGEAVSRAVIVGNVFTGPAQIRNESKGNVSIGLNAHD